MTTLEYLKKLYKKGSMLDKFHVWIKKRKKPKYKKKRYVTM